MILVIYLSIGALVAAIMWRNGEVEAEPLIAAVIFVIIAWPYIIYRIYRAGKDDEE